MAGNHPLQRWVQPSQNASLGMLAAECLPTRSQGQEGTDRGAVATGKLFQGEPVSTQH